MEFTPGTIQDNGNKITSVTGDFWALRTAIGWNVFYCGQTHTGQLIGGVMNGKFTFNPECNVSIDIDGDAIQLVCLLLHCQLEDDKRGSDTN